MSEDQENFEALRKLLSLKRHEQPPPGYFDRLPGQILSRLNKPEPQASLWERLMEGIVLRPAFAYSLGLVFCGTLALGIGYAVSVAPEQTANQVIPSEYNNWGQSSPTFAAQPEENHSPRLHVAGFVENNTNAQPSLFENPGFQTETVNFEKH
jgi:hypothetical protein